MFARGSVHGLHLVGGRVQPAEGGLHPGGSFPSLQRERQMAPPPLPQKDSEKREAGLILARALVGAASELPPLFLSSLFCLCIFSLSRP